MSQRELTSKEAIMSGKVKTTLTDKELETIEELSINFKKAHGIKPNIIVLPRNVWTLREGNVADRLLEKINGLLIIKSDFPIDSPYVGFAEFDEDQLLFDKEAMHEI